MLTIFLLILMNLKKGFILIRGLTRRRPLTALLHNIQRNNNTIYSTIYSQAINTYKQSDKATRLPELILQGALQ